MKKGSGIPKSAITRKQASSDEEKKNETNHFYIPLFDKRPRESPRTQLGNNIVPPKSPSPQSLPSPFIDNLRLRPTAPPAELMNGEGNLVDQLISARDPTSILAVEKDFGEKEEGRERRGRRRDFGEIEKWKNPHRWLLCVMPSQSSTEQMFP